MIKQLNQDNSELRVRLDEVESELKLTKKRCEELNTEISEVDRTNVFLRSEMNKRDALDLRDVTSIMMEYLAQIGNIVNEKDELETIRKLVNARTSHVCMKLEGQGLHVECQHAGDALKDGRVDTTSVETDDPTLDGKVVRSVRYGCSFRNDVYAPIVENVIVNRFVQKEEGKQ